ncbi:uncharacterized protein LOC108737787 [Agrilus planipennis]|uniref:Uncharacterized protein LOC108737787 n=1 Tax=Agrilus planipennis TaxID=224129 RepID=A0A1W4X237_AGRPL|nr:uncharacterized protein LOC108737787 [Agrilus planipennis]
MSRMFHWLVHFCAILLVISFGNGKTCLGVPLTRNAIACSSIEGPKISSTRVERSHDFFLPKGKSTSSLIPVMRTGRSVSSLIPAMRTGRSITSLIPVMRTGRSFSGLIPIMRTGRSMVKSLVPMMRTGRSDPNKTTAQELAEGLTDGNDAEYTTDLLNKWLQTRYSFLSSNASPAEDSRLEDSLHLTSSEDDPLNLLHQKLQFLFDVDS